MDWANSVSPERAWSLGYRITNEEILLAKAQERPIWGWGIWGRSQIYNEFGRQISTPDGYWIIVLGFGGWVKYIAEFGLLCVPVFIMFLRRKTYEIGAETTLLTLLLTANLFDLLPNATITPLTWLLAGALWGRVELGRLPEDSPLPDMVPQGRQKVRYSRFPGTAAERPNAPAATHSARAPQLRRGAPQNIRT